MEKIGEYTLILFENDILELKDLLEMSLNIILFHRNLSNNNYEDAQSKITSNSIVYCHKKSLSKASKDNNEIENKNKNNFVYNKNIYKSENIINNVDKKIINRNNINNNNKEKNSQSLYEEPKGSENEETYKEQTLFEGSNKRGDCCNLPKCFIF